MNPLRHLFIFISISFLTFQNDCVASLNAFKRDTSNSDIDSSLVVLDRILIVGNNKTKSKIISREISIQEGDTLILKDFKEAILKSKNRIFNTGLFVSVDMHLVEKDQLHKELVVMVKERWYMYPLPIFEVADRNFNEWWQQRGHDIRRTNIGLYYIQKNVRGRNETLKAKLQFGFTKKVELNYLIPYINKNQRTGLNLDFSYILNKQVAYKTTDHKLIYFDDSKINSERFRSIVTFTYRKKYYERHYFGGGFNYNRISDFISRLNPNYFLNGRTGQRFFSLEYEFIRDKRDVAYYPLKGSYFDFDAEKLGTGLFNDINQLNIITQYALYRPLSKKIFFAAGLKQKISFPRNQPFLQSRSLGYERDYVSGYELYVINGQQYSLAKVNVKWELYSVRKKVDAVPVKQFESIPFAIYLKGYTDAGYVVDKSFNPENTRFANKFLLGGGVGIDIVSYYDFVLRMEYSVNRAGQSGFFLHFGAGI